MEHASFTKCYTVADEMEINLNMFRALVLDGIGGNVRGADVDTINHRHLSGRPPEFMEELPQPT